MDAKAEDTETAGAAAATEEGTTAGKAGMSVEERLKARGTPLREDATGGEAPAAETAGAEEGAEADEGAEAEEGADAEDEIEDGEIEGLSPQTQAKINKRIHKLNIRRKNAEAKAEQTEAQLSDLGKKIQDENIQAAIKLGFDPNYITAEEAKTLNRVEQLRVWRRWLRAHRGETYEGNGTKDDPSMSTAEIAEREAAVEDELLDIGGSARTLAMERMALKDADAAIGRKIRLEGEKKPLANAPPKKAIPKPPKLPGGDGTSRRPPVSAGNKGKPVFDKNAFEKDGADKKALGKAYENLYGG